ncbi:MAG: hypothetical protein KUG56_08355 [Kordiimonadaceae bacterium]|nr:hypothetical protein [Kordiimonadaceae bacterium]
MRLFEFEKSSRGESLSLRTLHRWKCRHQAMLAAEEKRALLLPHMYGQADTHEDSLKAIKLEKEHVALAIEKAELAALRTKQSEGSCRAIERMSRATMRRRKKD